MRSVSMGRATQNRACTSRGPGNQGSALISVNFNKRRDRPRDARAEAIADTNRFLNWALAKERGIRRIPCRRVDEGGFRGVMRQRGTRALIRRFWDDLLERSPFDR